MGLQASKRQLPILVDAERLREGLDEMLGYADYVVASAKFPQVYSIPVYNLLSFLVQILCLIFYKKLTMIEGKYISYLIWRPSFLDRRVVHLFL